MSVDQTAAQPNHLGEIVCRKPTHLGFCNASGLGSRGVWLDPSCSEKYLVWRHLWPADIVANLVSSKNRESTITNYDLELAALILHKATLLLAVPGARLAAPRSGSDNTTAVSWSTKESSTISPVVTDLLRICALHSRQFFINSSISNHSGIGNRMAVDTSHLFDLYDIYLLTHMSAAYPQLHSLWKITLPLLGLLSCVIYTLRRKMCGQELNNILSIRSSTSSGATSVSPSRSILLSKIHLSLASRSSKSTGTASDMPSTPSTE